MAERTTGVGIDLGTSNSAVCRLDTSRGLFDFQHTRGDGGTTEIPSIVAAQGGRLYFGRAAERRASGRQHTVLRNFKLLLRRNEPVQLGDEVWEPVDLVHGFLAHLKENYERHFQDPLTRAVITVPAYEEFDFDYQARIAEAVRGRGGEAPLFTDVVTLKEPDAVLMSLIDVYRLVDQRVLVFDMGGGTLDVTIREVVDNSENPERPIMRALAVMGSDVAGVKVTEALGEWVLAQWERRGRFQFASDERAQAVRENFAMFDDVKKQLSEYGARAGTDSARAEHCHVEFAGRGQGYFDLDVPGSVLSELSAPLCQAALDTVEKAVAEAGLVPADIDSYFTVGGTSQLPLMQQMLTSYFGKAPVSRVSDHGLVDPYLAISKGASVHDFDRETAPKNDEPRVPNTAPVLEQKLPYDLSLLVDHQEALRVLVPKGAVLPHADVVQTFYMPVEDDNLDLIVYRGSGSVDEATALARRTITFPTKLPRNAEVSIRFSVSEDGTMTVAALGRDGEPIDALVARHNEGS